MKTSSKQRRGRPSRVPTTVLAIRRFIARRNLKAHDQLPSEPDLASTLGVSCTTLRKALAELADEGVLARQHGIGTFVNYQLLRTVGFAFQERQFYLPTSDFYRYLFRETQAWAEERQMNVCLVPRDDRGQLTANGIEMLRQREVDGVLLLTGNDWRDTRSRLQEFQIPAVHAFVREQDGVGAYSVAHRSTADKALLTLREFGASRVGLLGRHYVRRDVDRAEALALAQQLGLHIAPNWIFGQNRQEERIVQQGREAARQWLATTDRPLALMAADPYEVQGFLYELLGPGNQPEQMPLIALLEAKESVLDLPWPVLRLQASLRPVLIQALEMLDCLMRSEEPPDPTIIITPSVKTMIPDNLHCAFEAN